jgi:hypothetical protein
MRLSRTLYRLHRSTLLALRRVFVPRFRSVLLDRNVRNGSRADIAVRL